jgi:hypothetical protein
MSEKEVKLTAQFDADLVQLEARLAAEHPGVQAVMDVYTRAQASMQHVDSYVRILNPRPTVLTSNGSAG